MRWRVGNGKSIRIYTDKWLPRPSKFMIVSQPNLGSDETVDKLLSPSGGWNSELIKNNFLPDDAKCILQIPIGSGNQSDTLLWHYESNGKFSVRSGYWSGMETTLQALWECNRLRKIHKDWKLQISASGVDTCNFFDYVFDYFSKISKDQKELFCVVLWRIWFSRNSYKHGNRLTDWSDPIELSKK
ncbi:hypothetical protein Ddye_007451 [Dipteronia dyeriana]|uniref:Uncharacterized protein n=1 Tax=Dipteronia dyeriana TaxID=168575 RepID=A0AAD9XKG1_9ROSI|nr:hypothetical protein Ddye_007451 [Dipteronia dyeriana]